LQCRTCMLHEGCCASTEDIQCLNHVYNNLCYSPKKKMHWYIDVNIKVIAPVPQDWILQHFVVHRKCLLEREYGLILIQIPVLVLLKKKNCLQFIAFSIIASIAFLLTVSTDRNAIACLRFHSPGKSLLCFPPQALINSSKVTIFSFKYFPTIRSSDSGYFLEVLNTQVQSPFQHPNSDIDEKMKRQE
jgi:hypothetical protein